jgi:1-aminocyclopropane-1-carboxylate deaminase/D-cysteine desulfhydrase-like pyridoxal-dependent ACC family enzyme
MANPLFRALPGLEGRVPWVELGEWPTPVTRMRLPEASGGELWVKRDDLSSPQYGGNKVRKLEYLLAEACATGAGRLITTGVVGSHHCLATAVHGRRLGLPTSLVVFPQPMTHHAREMAELNLAWADEVRHCSTFATQPFVEAALRWRRRQERPYVIPGGGSSALGSLGHVGAALELAEQVRAGQMPRPATIAVAAGTLGTVAGLAIGVALTDVADRILAVRIVPSTIGNVWVLSRLVEGALRLLADAGATVPDARAVVDRVDLSGEYVGAGYGHATEAGGRATEWFASQDLPLDPSYTAKTAAAVLDRVASGSDAPVLYWHTLSAVLPPARPATLSPEFGQHPRAEDRLRTT